MRSGQQAALAGDLRELIEGLGLTRPIVAGFDWAGGPRAWRRCSGRSSSQDSSRSAATTVHDIAAMAADPGVSG